MWKKQKVMISWGEMGLLAELMRKENCKRWRREEGGGRGIRGGGGLVCSLLCWQLVPDLLRGCSSLVPCSSFCHTLLIINARPNTLLWHIEVLTFVLEICRDINDKFFGGFSDGFFLKIVLALLFTSYSFLPVLVVWFFPPKFLAGFFVWFSWPIKCNVNRNIPRHRI